MPVRLANIYNAWGFPPAISSGDLLFIGGQVGVRMDGSVPSDPLQQIDIAFENLGHVLVDAGASYDDVVDLTAFYTRYQEHSGLARPVREKYFGTDNPPNWTAMGVVALAEPFVFELKAIAHLPMDV
ncbi:MAG: Rid family hydrolase [Pseudomonadota bacterium]